MSAEWPIKRLGDLITIKHGFAFKGVYFSNAPTGDVLVTPGNFAIGGGFKNNKLKFYDGPVQQEYILKKDDLVVTMTDLSKEADTLGYPALIPGGDECRYLHNQRVGLVQIDSDKIDKLYLYFLMCTFEYRAHVLGSASGSTVKHSSPSKIESFEFNLPPLDIQERIGHYLITFEKKTSLNQKINQTLEQMAQALFKSWFVDFEPVKAKIAARQRWQVLQPENEPASPVCYAAELNESPAVGDLESYMNRAAMQAISGKTADQLDALREEDPERYQELYETATLFPSAMQDSELGEIPEGWTHGCLADIATYENERVQSEKLSIEDYVSTENMLENRKGICEASSKPSSATVPSFSPGQILVSNIRPYFKKIWLANKFGGRSPDVLGIKSVSFESSEFVYNLVYRDQFFDYMMLTSKGVKMPRGDKKAIMEFPCSLPTKELIEHFSTKVREFYSLADCRKKESKKLASLRDTLLPKLLSGELTVPNAEAQVAEVADA